MAVLHTFLKSGGLRDFFREMEGRTVAFIGLGVTNNGCIRQFKHNGLRVIICDRRCPEDMGELYEEFTDLGVEFSFGETYLEVLNTLKPGDFIMRAPGVYYNLPALKHARSRGIAVTSEMEMFFRYCPCPIYAVTGSDGKTTTTTIISEFLKGAGYTVHIGGNIGRALLPVIEEIQTTDRAVVELSSFQLMSMSQSPEVAVVTNISPNHLDVHKDMNEYIGAKRNIFLHQGAFSKTVLNLDNPVTAGFLPEVRGTAMTFSRQSLPYSGAYLDGEMIMFKEGEKKTALFPAHDIKLPKHHVENYMAAISATWHEVTVDVMNKVAREFGGVEHRTEFVLEKDGVRWYNDSIASSPTRVIAGLEAFSGPIVLIAGGYDKNIPCEPLAEPICRKVKALILLGHTADKIQKAVTEYQGYDLEKLKIIKVKTMEEAVEAASKEAVAGDMITLSPAAASFDLYVNFEARGNHFKELVRKKAGLK